MKAKAPLCPAACAFTLIELLVVVSIISILASLLLPALVQAKVKAQSTTCKSNLHQMGIAVQLYVNDFGGYPYEAQRNPSYRSSIDPPETAFVLWYNALQAYYPLRWTNVAFHCPAYHGMISTTPEFEPISNGSYSYNAYGTTGPDQSEPSPGLSGMYFLPDTFVVESKVRSPSDMISIVDARVIHGGFDPTQRGFYLWVWWHDLSPVEEVPGRHGRFFNTLFCDGHTSSPAYRDLIDPRKSWRNWNSDQEQHSARWIIPGP